MDYFGIVLLYPPKKSFITLKIFPVPFFLFYSFFFTQAQNHNILSPQNLPFPEPLISL